MNLKYHRISISGSEFRTDESGRGSMKESFQGIQKFKSVGMSIIFTAIANYDMPNGIKKGDTVFFKANNSRGIGTLGRTVESRGSCEDVAEVFCYHLLKNYSETLKEDAVLVGTPYNFSEYEDDSFWKIIELQSNYLIKSNRMYGCVSPNIIQKDGTILHGSVLLKGIFDKIDSAKTLNNNLHSYKLALERYIKEFEDRGIKVQIHPITYRYLANLLFFDYFLANSDRHSNNVNFQQIVLDDGSIIIMPLAVLDNGGALAMQDKNCEELYNRQLNILEANGKFNKSNGFVEYNPFDCQFDFNVGEQTFKNESIKNIYSNLSYVEQIIMLISQNKTLFNDFKNIYNQLDYNQALDDMIRINRFPENYLPGLRNIINAEQMFKREEISRAIANVLGVQFDEESFKQNPNLYLNMLETIVLDNGLSVEIATNEQIKEFNEKHNVQIFGNSNS